MIDFTKIPQVQIDILAATILEGLCKENEKNPGEEFYEYKRQTGDSEEE